MAGAAEDLIKRFWDIQNERDYSRLADLFAEDAVLEDPFYGTVRGKTAIAGFMTRMNEETGRLQTHFEAARIEGDRETAWAQWIAVSPKGRREGCGLHKVKSGKLAHCRDDMNPAKP